MSRKNLPPRARRLAAGALVGSAFLALLLAARPDAPLSVSLSLGRKFWRAPERSRLLNAPFLREDPEFAFAVTAADARWPLEVDVVLTLPPAIAGETAEKQRRAAALVLSPRRVLLERTDPAEGRFGLRPLPRGGP